MKYHLLVTFDGLRLVVAITRANRPDFMLVQPVLDGLSRVRAKAGDSHGVGPGSCTPTRQCACRRVRRYLRCRGNTARITTIGVDSIERRGLNRRVVERTIA